MLWRNLICSCTFNSQYWMMSPAAMTELRTSWHNYTAPACSKQHHDSPEPSAGLPCIFVHVCRSHVEGRHRPDWRLALCSAAARQHRTKPASACRRASVAYLQTFLLSILAYATVMSRLKLAGLNRWEGPSGRRSLGLVVTAAFPMHAVSMLAPNAKATACDNLSHFGAMISDCFRRR